MGRASLAAAACIALAGAGYSAEPPAAKFTCATCHRAEAESQSKTAMGIGMELPPNQTLLRAHPKLTFERNGYTYTIERKGDRSTYTVSDSSGTLSLPIQYAFGVHSQTFVLEYEGGFYESMVSYYALLKGLDVTVGNGKIQPHNLVEAMGRKNSATEITACFGCHSSGAVHDGRLTLASLQPGLTCEHCHTGANPHMESLAAGKPGPVPTKLGAMNAEQTSQFCGQCHRTWEEIVKLRQFGEGNVRFQPYRLANSRCFSGDDPRIRCTACHNPHANPVPEAAAYDHNCLACHSRNAPPVAGHDVPRAKICPVAQANCVSCHMPKVKMPGGSALFSDHQIRIVHPGDPYPN
ncbi:MAG TPA: multiheme c-type cytochrome [Bryobacteraceae bacterium]